MFKIDGREQSLTFTNALSLMKSQITVPLWIIHDFEEVKIKKSQVRLNTLFSSGPILLVVTILWLALKVNVQTWLFLLVYGLGIAFTFIKQYHDKKMVNRNDGEGETFIRIDTEWGKYLIDCEDECDKLKTFLETYLSKQ